MDKRTLVIDDDAVIRQFVSGILRSRGHSVLEADSGEAGIQIIRGTRPSLVICDICMEGLSGFEALERLRADPATATIPFILMTAEGGGEGMRKGMGLGADDYLVKPFSAADLMATIEAQERKRSVLRRQEEWRLQDLRTSISLSLPHELFTPLNAIFGFAEIINSLASGESKAEVQEMAGEILRAGERLNALMRNYLTYAQFEIFAADLEKVSRLRQARCDGASIVIGDAARAAAARSKREADLTIELSEGTLCIGSDHLAKVVEELAGNAFKFSAAGQRVTIRGTQRGNAYEILFGDVGRGLSADQIASIGAFTQFDRDRNEQQGLGLGLAIVKRITEVYAGKFRVESSSQGTRVTVELPCE